MSQLINAKINLSKIEKAKLFTGKKGIYLDLSIWINDGPDQYGNDISIQQSTKKDEPKIYIGAGKYFVKRVSDAEVPPPVKVPEKAFTGQEGLPPAVITDIDDLPF
jgi:hypothetical protein